MHSQYTHQRDTRRNTFMNRRYTHILYQQLTTPHYGVYVVRRSNTHDMPCPHTGRNARWLSHGLSVYKYMLFSGDVDGRRGSCIAKLGGRVRMRVRTRVRMRVT